VGSSWLDWYSFSASSPPLLLLLCTYSPSSHHPTGSVTLHSTSFRHMIKWSTCTWKVCVRRSIRNLLASLEKRASCRYGVKTLPSRWTHTTADPLYHQLQTSMFRIHHENTRRRRTWSPSCNMNDIDPSSFGLITIITGEMVCNNVHAPSGCCRYQIADGCISGQ
jgi:hypothetical protein